ncbi:MAG TPA: DNA repair protein RecN [Thermoanaerobaculia bacterium]|jgi:DNA repair protein RecN (Recombination protein N)
MLRRLTVRNLAIVEDLELDLEGGLTVVTGETGAGKSILVDAVALLAGARGSSDLVREGAGKLVVAGEFDATAGARAVVAEAGLPDGETLLVRRELSSDGRGRAFVEDEPASVRTLARLGETLVAIHGQNSEQDLTERAAPLEVLDAFARCEEEREATARAAAAWKEAREALERLEASRRDRAARLEMLDYQIGELDEAAPSESEEASLAAERERLRHADRIRLAGEKALAALSEGESSAADRLGEAARAFGDLAAIDPREAAHLEEAEELKRRIADLAAAARDAASEIEADPGRLTAIETRLEKIGRLVRKHGTPAGELPALLTKLRLERGELANMEDALERRQRESEQARAAYLAAAGRLTQKRRAASERFSSAVEKELQALAMEKARFRVALSALDPGEPRAAGLESASLLFAPNPGEPEKPVEKIASGGELSRLQLAIRTAAAGRKSRGRTLVFDEVDAGIGGRTAEVVGKKLRELARGEQVLCVTHVPQIAALAHRHFRAEKLERGGRTIASVRRLEGKERVEEVARMLAGEKVPETALKHARALLEAAAP